MQKWIITFKDMPEIISNCSKCGGNSKFCCDNCFRMNANGKNLDVWLIYKCTVCKTTLKLEIFSRVKSNQIDKKLYQSFLQNDIDTVRDYAFNTSILKRNKVNYHDVMFSIEKQICKGVENELSIILKDKLPIRLDKLLSEGYGISRSIIQNMIETGKISCKGQEINSNYKIRTCITLTVDF